MLMHQLFLRQNLHLIDYIIHSFAKKQFQPLKHMHELIHKLLFLLEFILLIQANYFHGNFQSPLFYLQKLNFHFCKLTHFHHLIFLYFSFSSLLQKSNTLFLPLFKLALITILAHLCYFYLQDKSSVVTLVVDFVFIFE